MAKAEKTNKNRMERITMIIIDSAGTHYPYSMWCENTKHYLECANVGLEKIFKLIEKENKVEKTKRKAIGKEHNPES